MLGHRYAVGRGAAQDYAVAAYWFDQAARRDDPISMTALGFLRAAGRGVAQSWPEAIRWWRRAEGRTPIAARYLGDAYACGVGVEVDHERAISAYRRAADHEMSAAIQLGHMYLRGCPATDEAAALATFQRAADQGVPEAQIEVSELLRQGRGGDMNVYMAYFWARVAERRLPPGPLQRRAAGAVEAAARLMSGFEIGDADKLIADIVARGAEPMR
jgi:TPR repeat protein